MRASARPQPPPQANSERMLRRINELAEIGLMEDGSCCRLALTDLDRDGRRLVKTWMEEAGLAVRIDRIGNMIGVQEGRSGAPVMTGSHIDTVATGGRYDGVYGVLAGIEVVQTLQDARIETNRPLAVTVFTNEEGVRFQPDMMGSLVYAGGLALEQALAARAEDGALLGEELARIGFAGDMPCGAVCPHAFVELHIEQGPVLDREGGVLGAVTDLQGISWREVTVHGVSNHAGTTPMNLRHDAGYCAGRIAVFVRELAEKLGGSQVATVGAIRLSPGLISVIPRQAVVTVDLRNTDDEALSRAERELDAFLQELAGEERVRVECRQLVRTKPVVFDERVVAVIEAVAAQMRQPIRRMTSGAGHDAQMIAAICPAAMIFVPSRAGISHNPREFTEPQHLAVGANALLHVMMQLAQ